MPNTASMSLDVYPDASDAAPSKSWFEYVEENLLDLNISDGTLPAGAFRHRGL
jgi:hypothetical protein